MFERPIFDAMFDWCHLDFYRFVFCFQVCESCVLFVCCFDIKFRRFVSPLTHTRGHKPLLSLIYLNVDGQ